MTPLQVTKAYRTTSTEALQVIAGVIPIDLLVEIGAKVSDLMQMSAETVQGQTAAKPTCWDRATCWQLRLLVASAGNGAVRCVHRVAPAKRAAARKGRFNLSNVPKGEGGVFPSRAPFPGH